jgi:hypothetical protein
MATPSQQLIAATLNANGGSRWQEIYSKRAARVLADAARPFLPVVPFGLSANWATLDNAGFRQQALAASPSALEVAQDLASLRRKQRQPTNALRPTHRRAFSA